MIRTIVADGKSEYEALAGLAGRGGAPGAEVEQAVRKIIEDVRAEGDAAVVRYAQQFDGPCAAPGGRIKELSRGDLKAAFESLGAPLADALLHAAQNIRAYHERQAEALKGYEERYPNRGGAEGPGGIDDAGDVVIGQVVRGLARIGVYVPGGTAAYPSTVLMNVIPAKLAGVGEIVMVTPPGMGAGFGADAADAENADRRAADAADESRRAATGADAAVLGAAYIAGVDRVFLAGGAQALAALALGTESFPRVDKIVGPGNIYVATAKRLLYGVVDIDMIAGPSEILVIADGSADAAFVAADLLSQAEHDPLSASILLTTDPGLAEEAAAHVEKQLKRLTRQDTARKAIDKNGLIIICRSEDEMAALANEAAPEHVQILTADPFGLLTQIKNAGSVFLGAFTPEPVGDYYAGTNHVLPTGGTARFASPLGVYDFVKRMSYTHYTKAALEKAKGDIIMLGNAEGLTAHVNAVKIRFDD
ncbi:MAG: histidinol dehydrogenase [Clostridiales bacterium]|nr:histidinol dehydrogenase [Clostridiales bacterium]